MNSLKTLKQTIKKLVAPFRPVKPEKSPREQLQEIPMNACDSINLANISDPQLREWLNDQEVAMAWESVKGEINNLRLPEMTGGVNPGDQRAIFYLISALKPKTVLEVGTHIGCSTVHIASALKALSEKDFLTVDIRDVNDTEKQPWTEFNSPASPAQLIQQVEGQDFTRFQVSTSLDFFKQSEKTFDFIFLDGLHDAYMVYQEIPVALQHLNLDGFILLHDYFPNEQSLWEGYPPIVGPYLAVKRLQEEGANLRVLPLGELPWETKLGTKVTSLALLTKN
ncbi:MAG: class I SAM-dependent methyltransferase [Microcystaceae cyanobacterium]